MQENQTDGYDAVSRFMTLGSGERRTLLCGRGVEITITEASVLDGVTTIGSRIRGRRSALGLSQQQLADRVGIGRKAIGHLEAGHHQPSARRLSQLAAALEVPVSWLLTGEDTASEQDVAQTAGIAELQREMADINEAIRLLERRVLDVYRLVERLSEQQIRFLSPGDPPWSDSP